MTAKAIETGTAETAGLGPKDESAVASAICPTPVGMTPPYEELVERLRETAELVRREPVLVADQDPFIELWNTDACKISEQLDAAATRIEELLRDRERLTEALRQIEFLSTNHGGWFEDDAWKWAQMMGDEARAALTGDQ